MTRDELTKELDDYLSKNFTQCEQWRVDKAGLHPDRFYLRLVQVSYLNGVRQMPRDVDLQFDRHSLREFALGILEIVEPTTDQKILQTLERIEKFLRHGE